MYAKERVRGEIRRTREEEARREGVRMQCVNIVVGTDEGFTTCAH